MKNRLVLMGLGLTMVAMSACYAEPVDVYRALLPTETVNQAVMICDADVALDDPISSLNHVERMSEYDSDFTDAGKVFVEGMASEMVIDPMALLLGSLCYGGDIHSAIYAGVQDYVLKEYEVQFSLSEKLVLLGPQVMNLRAEADKYSEYISAALTKNPDLHGPAFKIMELYGYMERDVSNVQFILSEEGYTLLGSGELRLDDITSVNAHRYLSDDVYVILKTTDDIPDALRLAMAYMHTEPYRKMHDELFAEGSAIYRELKQMDHGEDIYWFLNIVGPDIVRSRPDGSDDDYVLEGCKDLLSTWISEKIALDYYDAMNLP